ALNGDVSPALKQVINKALSYECADRYPTTNEFSRAITEAAAGVAAPVPDETVFAPKPLTASPPKPDEASADASLSHPAARSPLPIPDISPLASAASAIVPRPDQAEHAAEPPPLAIELLSEVERDLTTFIGPMAKIAVRRAAKTTV